jgi:hypothetical protein
MPNCVSALGALFAKRADVSGDIGCLVSAQREIRHLGMRVEKEESNLFRSEIRPSRDCCKRWNVGVGLCLAAVNQVTGGAPALRELRAMIRIRGHYR